MEAILSVTSVYEELYNKIENRAAKVFVVGLGYVGLPTAVQKAKQGFNVVGYDVSETKVEMINRGKNYIGDVDDDELKDLVKDRYLQASDNPQDLAEADVIVVCVPTPLDEYKNPELTAVKQTAKAIGENIKEGTLVIFESTTYPGTTEEVILPQMNHYRVGEDVFLAYSPERIDPSNQQFNIENTPKVVGGLTESCTEMAVQFLGGETVKTSSPRVAEMAKIYENTFRWVNIALANEMAVICEKMDMDVWEVIDSAATKPYGFMPFYPSSGVGGHCIPIDPYYLSWKLKEENYQTKMINAAGAVNDDMPNHVVSRLSDILNNEGKALSQSKVLIMGVAYKKDVNDVRESPMLHVIEKLKRNKADVSVADPYVSSFVVNGSEKVETHDVSEELVKEADIVLIGTDHTNVDYQMIGQKAHLIFDTKNALNQVPCSGKYVRL